FDLRVARFEFITTTHRVGKVSYFAQTRAIDRRSLSANGKMSDKRRLKLGEVKCQTLVSSGCMRKRRCFRPANAKPTMRKRCNSILRVVRSLLPPSLLIGHRDGSGVTSRLS